MGYDHGSIDRALKGEYSISFHGVLTEAWQRTKGAKLIFLSATFVYAVMGAVMGMLLGLIFDSSVYYEAGMFMQGFLSDQAQSMLSLPVLLPVIVAIAMLGIKRATDNAIEISSIFDYYVLVWPLVFASLLMNLLITVGFMLLVLPGIYLAVAYAFTLPLMIDKKLGIWEAMELSRKSVTQQWFRFFVYDIMIILLIVISAIPFGIGLIWTIPMAYIGYGILYRKMFGYGEPEHKPTFMEDDHSD